MIDFKDWLRLSVAAGGLSNKLTNQGFIWIDDGKNNLEFIDFNLVEDGKVIDTLKLITKEK